MNVCKFFFFLFYMIGLNTFKKLLLMKIVMFLLLNSMDIFLYPMPISDCSLNMKHFSVHISCEKN
jgi:hypothetical protein